jgi:phospholipid-binding lipoprotein MlaA
MTPKGREDRRNHKRSVTDMRLRSKTLSPNPLVAVLLAVFLIAGCATMPDPSDKEAVAEFNEINDPGEPAMRAIFEVNLVLDKMLLKPAAEFYKGFMPPALQRGVHNFLNNLRTPIILLNDVLQGKSERAGTTLARFFVNSTIGVLGFSDQAAEMGMEFHNEDFGQTLAVWGADEGPYVMLPIFGPSNPRDAVGLAVDFLSDPINIWAGNTDRDAVIWARSGTRAVDQRARNFDIIEDLEKSSLDFYATVRSLYRQRRKDEINDSKSSGNLPASGLGQNSPFPVTIDGSEVSQSK